MNTAGVLGGTVRKVAIVATALLTLGAAFHTQRSALDSAAGAQGLRPPATAQEQATDPAPDTDPPAEPAPVAMIEPPAPAEATACGGRRIPLTALAEGNGSLAGLHAGTDRGATLAGAGVLLVRIALDGGAAAPSVLIDLDDDRATGMWTYQSNVSPSGWDLLVDASGAVHRHAGTSTEWAWNATGARATRSTAAGHVDLCMPVSPLGAGERIRIAVLADGEWLPQAFLPGAAFPPEQLPAPATSAPAGLAFHYGATPWIVRDCRNPADLGCAVDLYGRFGHVVFGAGLEDRTHPSHTLGSRLVGDLRRAHPDTEVWGYISLVGTWVRPDGRRDHVYSVNDILERAAAWQRMGVTGIFIDEADLCDPARGQRCPAGADGSPTPITRARQAAVVEGIHAMGLAVFANAYAPLDVLGAFAGAPSPLTGAVGTRPADMYLLENPTVSSGALRSGLDAAVGSAKYEVARRSKAATGVRVAAVDTSGGPVPDSATGTTTFRTGFEAAANAGADAYGFTNESFSASPAHAVDLFLPPATR